MTRHATQVRTAKLSKIGCLGVLKRYMNNDKVSLTRSSPVSLREVTKETLWDICKLSVTEEQNKFVSNNTYSIAEAHFNQPRAWFRGIYADDTPIGFLMLDDQPDKPEYYLWRFMIDARFQGMGYGRQALNLLIAHVKTRPNATELFTSVVQAEGGPQPFYEKLGFEPTGEYEDGEAVLKLKWRS